MTNFVFACASVNGLTLNQKRETIKALRASIAEEVQLRRIAKRVAAEERATAKAVKLQTAEQKRIAAIAKAQARLDKLLSAQVGKVGHKAAKANRRASKVVTYGAEANAIADKIKANRVQKELF
jgi:hypothetical protein